MSQRSFEVTPTKTHVMIFNTNPIKFRMFSFKEMPLFGFHLPGRLHFAI